MMHKKQLAWAVALAIHASVPRASAHGGEDHAAPAAPSAVSTGTEHVVSGETVVFSVVIKYPAKKAEGPFRGAPGARPGQRGRRPGRPSRCGAA